MMSSTNKMSIYKNPVSFLISLCKLSHYSAVTIHDKKAPDCALITTLIFSIMFVSFIPKNFVEMTRYWSGTGAR